MRGPKRPRIFCNFAARLGYSRQLTHTMKTMLISTFLAAPAAFVLSPDNFDSLVSLFFGAGLVAIVIADYARAYRPLRTAAPVGVAAQRSERFGLAA